MAVCVAACPDKRRQHRRKRRTSESGAAHGDALSLVLQTEESGDTGGGYEVVSTHSAAAKHGIHADKLSVLSCVLRLAYGVPASEGIELTCTYSPTRRGTLLDNLWELIQSGGVASS